MRKTLLGLTERSGSVREMAVVQSGAQASLRRNPNRRFLKAAGILVRQQDEN